MLSLPPSIQRPATTYPISLKSTLQRSRHGGSLLGHPDGLNFCLGAFKLPERNFTIPRNRLPVPKIEGMCLEIIQCL
jgi:hypothetical protein